MNKKLNKKKLERNKRQQRRGKRTFRRTDDSSWFQVSFDQAVSGVLAKPLTHLEEVGGARLVGGLDGDLFKEPRAVVTSAVHTDF